MVATIEKIELQEDVRAGISFDEALDLAGFGRYTLGVVALSSLLILAMGIDLYGVSLVLPNLACDLSLDTNQRALLSGLPLAGAVCMCYVWGLSADARGRRSMLLLGMGVGFLLNLLASMAPEWISFTILKLLSAGFCASANAIGVVYLGESTPLRYRSAAIYVMLSAASLTQLFISVFGLPILPLSFAYRIPYLRLTYRSWRLLLQVTAVPSGLGCLMLYWHRETPKFQLNCGRSEDALETLRNIYAKNTGKPKESYPVTAVYLEESPRPDNAGGGGVLRLLWRQTVPLFTPPLLKHSLKVYFILIVCFTTGTSYSMWVPSLTNMYFSGGETEGKTFCEVASRAAADTVNTTIGPHHTVDCPNLVERNTLWAVMVYSGSIGAVNLLLSLIVGFAGRKKTTLTMFAVSSACGIALNFVTVPTLSMVLFFVFLYVGVVIAAVHSYIIELYPTYLRSTAVCVSVMLCRASGMLGINVIAWLLHDYCTLTVYGFVFIVICGGIVSCFLPPDSNDRKHKT